MVNKERDQSRGEELEHEIANDHECVICMLAIPAHHDLCQKCNVFVQLNPEVASLLGLKLRRREDVQ